MSRDLLDLLRLQCASGKLRLNVFGGSTGYQGNLANSGTGWATSLDDDPLRAMEIVLRGSVGAELRRERTGVKHLYRNGVNDRLMVTDTDPGTAWQCVNGITEYEQRWADDNQPDDEDGIGPDDIEHAALMVLDRFDLPFSGSHVAEAIAEQLFPLPAPTLHSVENVKLGDLDRGYGPAGTEPEDQADESDDFDCLAAPVAPVDDTDDFAGLL